MADIKSDPVIDYADGRPHWVLDGDEVYGAVPVSLIRAATTLAIEAQNLSEREEANALQPDADLSDAWSALDDERAELVFRLAELFGFRAVPR